MSTPNVKKFCKWLHSTDPNGKQCMSFFGYRIRSLKSIPPHDRYDSLDTAIDSIEEHVRNTIGLGDRPYLTLSYDERKNVILTIIAAHEATSRANQ